MQFAGITPVDAPDPQDELRAKVARLGFDVAGLIEQPHLEYWGALGLGEQRRGTGDSAVTEQATVALSYTLWRNPQNHGDPANLRELDDATRLALEAAPPWPRPAWILRTVERMRYPMIWEAVQTHWTAPGIPPQPPADRLVAHVEHVLNNRFRDEHRLPPMSERPWVSPVGAGSVQHDHPVIVDGVERAGLLVDTDPFVIGIGAVLDDGRVLTSVIPRDALPLLRIAFASATELA